MPKFFAKITPETESYSDFACSCAGLAIKRGTATHVGYWSYIRCQKALAWAYEFLSYPGHPCTAENFMSKAIYILDGRYGATMSVATDQWAGIYFDRGEKRVNKFSTSVECDELEHGLAFSLRAFVKRFGEKGPGYDYIEEDDDH